MFLAAEDQKKDRYKVGRMNGWLGSKIFSSYKITALIGALAMIILFLYSY